MPTKSHYFSGNYHKKKTDNSTITTLSKVWLEKKFIYVIDHPLQLSYLLCMTRSLKKFWCNISKMAPVLTFLRPDNLDPRLTKGSTTTRKD